MNLKKQYNDRIAFCERELIKVNEQRGASDNSQKYIEFQTGMFEVIKLNLMKYINVIPDLEIVKGPKVETFGINEAEERYNLDVSFNCDGRTEKVKLLIFNTTCSIMVQSQPTNSKSISVAQSFINTIIKPIVEDMKKRININEVNDK